MVRKNSKVASFDIDELDSPDAISEYITVALQSRDRTAISRAIGAIIKAKGVGDIAAETGLARTNLYRAFDGTRTQKFETIRAVLATVGVELIAQPIKQKRRKC